MIKKTTLILAFVSFWSSFCHSQNLTYGLVGEIGHGWVNYKNIDRSSNSVAPSYGVGIYVNKKLTPKSAFEVNLKWFRHKDDLQTKTNRPDHAVNYSDTRIAHYVSIPLVYYYRISKKLQVGLGPQVSYLISGNTESISKGFIGTRRYYDGYYLPYEPKSRFDFGANIRVAYNLPNNISLFMSHYHGVQNTSESWSERTRRNKIISIGVNWPLMPDDEFD